VATESIVTLPLAGGTLAMIPEYDIDYSVRREAQERAAAAVATDPMVRDIHIRMADRYADRAWSGRERRCEDGNPC